MTAPTHRVQLLKQESTALGGSDADARDYPVPINPQEDAPEMMGLYLQDATHRDTAVYVTRVGDDIVFRDASNPTEKTLTQVLAGNPDRIVFDDDGRIVFTDDGEVVTN